MTNLHILASMDNTEALKSALRHGSSGIDALDREGNTALILAAWRGYEVSGRILAEAGANPDIPNRMGLTAREIALERGHTKFVAMLDKVAVDRIEAAIEKERAEDAAIAQRQRRINAGARGFRPRPG